MALTNQFIEQFQPLIADDNLHYVSDSHPQ